LIGDIGLILINLNMTKAVEMIVILTLLIFAFFIGVKYSDSVKSHAGWLFEIKEEEVELPDLVNESAEVDLMDENGVKADTINPVPAPPVENEFVPSDINQDVNSDQAIQP
jgi:hypothetical protein